MVNVKFCPISRDPVHSIRMLVEWNPVPGIQSPRRKIQNLGFSYMGRSRAVLVRTSMPYKWTLFCHLTLFPFSYVKWRRKFILPEESILLRKVSTGHK